LKRDILIWALKEWAGMLWEGHEIGRWPLTVETNPWLTASKKTAYNCKEINSANIFNVLGRLPHNTTQQTS
jgi:hypothetical protein